jgi:excisionase family DNA binding protein
MTEPMFLTPEEAAELLRTTRGAIYTLASRGKLPGSRRFGRRLLVCRRELLESLATSVALPSKGEGDA